MLGACCFLVYLTNIRSMAAQDSIPARLLPFSLLREGNVDFDEFKWLFSEYPRPYYLNHTRSGHWLSAYAIGAPLLVTPLSLPAVWWLHAHHIEDDDVRFRVVTVVMERVGAATFTAASVSLLYLALCSVTTAPFALGTTLVYGLGTNTWAVGSQSMLQHGAAEMMLAGLSLFLLGDDTRRRAVGAGMFAALGVIVRPTMLVFALLAFAFMWFERRRHIVAFLVVPFAGAAALWAYNRGLGGLVQGGYHGFIFTRPQFDRFMGLLISPNRGVLVYTPVTALALPAIWQRDPPRLRWCSYILIGVGVYLLLYSAWIGWWGGNTYGPRFLTDALPGLALCAAPVVERLWRSHLWRAVVCTLVLWGVAVQIIGVYFDDNGWNMSTRQGVGPGRRVWSTFEMQIPRAARAGWHGTRLLPLVWQTFTDPHPALLREMRAEDLAGEMSVEEALPLHYTHAHPKRLALRLTNKSQAVWPAFSDYGFMHCRVIYRWYNRGESVEDTGAMVLPRNLDPGESITLHGWLDVPAQPGQYQLHLMLLQMLHADRGVFGGVELRLPVQVD